MKRWSYAVFSLAVVAFSNHLSAELSSVEDAIPAPVKALGKPTAHSFQEGIQMAVSATTDAAQAAVNQGLNHLHGGWEFEASRHFAEAMREDPECLMAHWGMVMSLLNPSPETGEARNAATDRMLALIEQGKGTELERGYAYGLVKYIEEGPAGALVGFRKVADKYPNDLQASVFAALFSRGGYDDAGDATASQTAAEASLLELIEKHPKNPGPLNALLLIRAEAPDLSASLELARKLCQMVPDYPPYFHLLGHYQWRCGKHDEAVSSFGRASSFYQKWMKENQATVADCPEWVRAECYRIVSVVSKGEFDTAYAAARQVASIPLPENRPSSAGARCIMWDAKTLPARILIHRRLVGNSIEAARSLPKPEEVREFHKTSLAYWWIDGLRFALEAQRLVEVCDLAEAHNVMAALTLHGEKMAKTRDAANASGERSNWNRAFRALEVLASDIRGRIAMASPPEKRASAFNWFSSAADRQHPAPMLMPPLILSPMASRLGEYYLISNKPDEAIAAYQRALAAFPNDINSLLGLKRAHEAANQAEETTKKIKALKDE